MCHGIQYTRMANSVWLLTQTDHYDEFSGYLSKPCLFQTVVSCVIFLLLECALRVQSLIPLAHFLCCVLVIEDVNSQFPALVTCMALVAMASCYSGLLPL